ncbi:hypothetical protein KQH40_01155 [bacterium]|nr:hypothetical protein [bacterium]
MAKKNFNSKKVQRKYTEAVQNFHIQKRFPQFSVHRSEGWTIWRGKLQPRVISPEYEIEIRYLLGKIPKVWVISPYLVDKPPHIYNKDKSLCLYWPKEWVWESNEFIATTIIPWVANWLYYYELWLDTGEWLGPSSHDNTPKQE